MKTRSQTSSAKNPEKGLSAWQSSQLINLIEKNGGIDSFRELKEYRLAQLFNADTETFGTKSSKLRRAYENKVYKLKVKSPYEYLKLLTKFKIQPFANRSATEQAGDETYRYQVINESSDEASQVSLSSTPGPGPQSTPRLYSSPESLLSTPEPRNEKLTFTPKKATFAQNMVSHPTVYYKDEMPTSNDCIAGIFTSKDIVGLDNKSFYEGFDIWMEVDPR